MANSDSRWFIKASNATADVDTIFVQRCNRASCLLSMFGLFGAVAGIDVRPILAVLPVLALLALLIVIIDHTGALSARSVVEIPVLLLPAATDVVLFVVVVVMIPPVGRVCELL